MASILMVSGAAFADSAALTTQGYVDAGLKAVYKAIDAVKADADDLDDLTETVGTLSDTVATKADASDVYTKKQIDDKGFLTTASIEGKQDTISDLSNIRAGAAAGATALQPQADISSLTNDAGYLTAADVAVYQPVENGGVSIDEEHNVKLSVTPVSGSMYVYTSGGWSALNVEGTFPDNFNFAGD